MGSHQEDLALFTLPASPDEDEEDEASEGSISEATVEMYTETASKVDTSGGRKGQLAQRKIISSLLTQFLSSPETGDDIQARFSS